MSRWSGPFTNIWSGAPTAGNRSPRCRQTAFSAASVRAQVRDQSADGKLQSHWSQSLEGSAKPGPIQTETLPPGLAEHPDYEILCELGRGGMGVVYLAQNRLMGRNEVLKVVSGHLINRTGVADRFLREIRAAANLHHANIVTAYSAFHAGESLVFAMEYVEGHDLADLVKGQRPLQVTHACNFVYQAAVGLHYAHEHGMVHRDIKPSNLMVTRRGHKPVVKVLDFGLAKVTSEGEIRKRPDSRRPDARHAGLHRARTNTRRPVCGHPRRRLQPGLHLLLSSRRETRRSTATASGTCTRRTSRWTPTR